MRAARVHHAARRRGGGVAARGARAAERADAAHRRVMLRLRTIRSIRHVSAAFLQGLQQLAGSKAATWGSISLGWRQYRRLPHEYAAELVALAARRYSCRRSQPSALLQATTHDADRVLAVGDPVGAGFVDSSGAAGR